MASSLEERLKSRLSTVVKQAATDMSTVSFSGYLVKRLIKPNTFRNVIDEDGAVKGFQIELKNKIGGATIVGSTPFTVDGEEFAVEQVVITKSAKVFRAEDISESNPMPVKFGDEFTVMVEDGQGLESGSHRIELGLKMAGLGIVTTSFDEKLVGEGRKRIRKAAPATGGDADFAEITKKAFDYALENIGSKKIAECAKILDVVVLDLAEDGAYSVLLGRDGNATYQQGAASGKTVLRIRTSKAMFHNMAHNKVNPGIAYARGDIKLEGVPVLKLRGMDSLITSIFKGYRAASEGIEFEDAAFETDGGIVQEMLGVTFMVFDEALKAIGKVLGFVGVDYFYEKALNRIEWVWDIVDREMRDLLSFGHEEEVKEASEDATTPVAEKAKSAAKAAPSLRDKIKERISTAVETAVSEISRSAVSGYLVKRLIEPGSFRNYEESGEVQGFEVKLKNKLGTATITGFTAIKINGEDCPLETIEIAKGRQKVMGGDISESKPMLVSFGDVLLIRVKRPGGMKPGKHKVTMGINMVGMGGIDVDYEEELSV